MVRINGWPVLVTIGAMTVGMAHAQPAAPAAPLSARETAYGPGLAQRLGLTGGEVTRLQFPMPLSDVTTMGMVDTMAPDVPAAPTSPARSEVIGVRVDLDGVQVDRLRFESAAEAREYMARHTGDGTPPTYSELRGNQVLVAKGAPVRDPEFVKKLRRSAWQGLSAPHKTDAMGVQADGDMALSTRQTEGPIWDSINKAVLAARERADNPGIDLQTPDRALVSLNNLRAQVQSDAAGASAWTTTNPDRAEAIARHLEALGGHPTAAPTTGPAAGPAAATEGTARRIDRIFGR